MDLRTKIEKLISSERDTFNDILKRLEETATTAINQASTDGLGMTPGLGLSHSALNMAIYGTRLQEQRVRISMLEWLLRDDEDK